FVAYTTYSGYNLWRGYDHLNLFALALAQAVFGGVLDVIRHGADEGDLGFLAFGFELFQTQRVDGHGVAAEIQSAAGPRVLRLECRPARVAADERVHHVQHKLAAH